MVLRGRFSTKIILLGTLNDARLSSNVALLNGANDWSGARNDFSTPVNVSSNHNLTFENDYQATCYGGCNSSSIFWNGTSLVIRVN